MCERRLERHCKLFFDNISNSRSPKWSFVSTAGWPSDSGREKEFRMATREWLVSGVLKTLIHKIPQRLRMKFHCFILFFCVPHASLSAQIPRDGRLWQTSSQIVLQRTFHIARRRDSQRCLRVHESGETAVHRSDWFDIRIILFRHYPDKQCVYRRKHGLGEGGDFGIYILSRLSRDSSHILFCQQPMCFFQSDGSVCRNDCLSALRNRFRLLFSGKKRKTRCAPHHTLNEETGVCEC